MRNLPDWFVEGVLKDPYSAVPRVEWTYNRRDWHPLQTISGSHTEDAGSQTRWSFSGSFVADYPVNELGIHPYGCRARVFLDFVVNGRPYSLPCGVYSITRADRTEDVINLSGLSFETDVMDAEFSKPRRIPDKKNSTYKTQTETLIREAVPDARFYWSDDMKYVEEGIPRSFFDGSRWTVIDGDNQAGSLMGALGAVAYCDYSGAFRFKPIPRLGGKAVWRVSDEDGVRISTSATLDRTGVHNVLTVASDDYTGAGAGPGFAWDDDPNSLTYAGPDPINQPGVGAAPFGIKPVKYTNSLINSDHQATMVARAQLQNYLGLKRDISFESVFHPGLEADDIVAVEDSDGRTALHLLESLSYTWGDATISGVTRSSKPEGGGINVS